MQFLGQCSWQTKIKHCGANLPNIYGRFLREVGSSIRWKRAERKIGRSWKLRIDNFVGESECTVVSIFEIHNTLDRSGPIRLVRFMEIHQLI